MRHASLSVRVMLVLQLLSLVLLALAPTWWELWRIGRIPLPLPYLLLVLMGLVALLAIPIGRASSPGWRHLWWVWLLSWLLVPVQMVLLDMEPAMALPLPSLGMLVLTLVGIGRSESWWLGHRTQLVMFLGAVALGFMIFLNLAFGSWIGVCHALSSWRRAGCVYSMPLYRSISTTPAFVYKEGGEILLAVPHESMLWLEPFDRWQRHLRSRSIMLDYPITFISVANGGARIGAFYLEPGLVWISRHWQPNVRTLIDPDRGEILDQVAFVWTEELLLSYREAWDAFDARTPLPDEPEWSTVSTTGAWRVVGFHDGRLAFWTQRPLPPPETLSPIEPGPRSIEIPDGPPAWTFNAEINYRCTTFNQSETLLVAHAGHDQDQLDVYDLAAQERVLSLPLEANGPCPVATADKKLVAVANRLEQDALFLIEIETGQTTATLPLPDFSNVKVEFSPDDAYLLPTLNNEDAALVLDVEAVLNSAR